MTRPQLVDPDALAALDEDPAPDMVNAPPHYAALPCGVEPIDIVEHLPFNRGAAVKYLLRTGLKGGPEQAVEDLRKAAFYCTREADRIEKAQASS